MAQQTIGIGTTANDGTGDPLRTVATKSNLNFTELYGKFVDSTLWTPVLTFATPGNLAVTYANQLGRYVRVGKLIMLEFVIITSAFTWTTASGNCQITGLPFASENVAGMVAIGELNFSGITKAGATQITPLLPANASILQLNYSGSGIAQGAISAADMPSGGSVILRGNIQYIGA